MIGEQRPYLPYKTARIGPFGGDDRRFASGELGQVAARTMTAATTTSAAAGG